MREMTSKYLKNTMQDSIAKVKKLEPKTFSEKIQVAKTIGYLVSVASQVIEKHELEKRLNELEKTISVVTKNETR